MLFCRSKQSIIRDGQLSIGIGQPQDKTFTSSDKQHLYTVSHLKSPSTAPFAGSRVDSTEDGSLYNREDKIPI